MKVYIYVNHQDRQFGIYNKLSWEKSSKSIYHDDFDDDTSNYILEMCASCVPTGYDNSDPNIPYYMVTL